MLLTGTDVLRRARLEGWAIAGFSVYNLETVQAVCAAAEMTGRPLLLQAGSSAFMHAGREPLATLAVQAARAATTPVGVHLDHCRDIDEISACIDAGYTSVMFDGSHLPMSENIRLTRQVVELAHAHGVWVEGELGAIPGDEDRSLDAIATEMTDPQQAAEFAAATGVDALAVAIGNVHGYSPSNMTLDLERLGEIARLCSAPLVLHGASGVDDATLRRCAALGVVKFNVNTELRRAFFDAVEQALGQTVAGYDLASLMGAGRTAVRDTAAAIATMLGQTGHDDHGELERLENR
jgi:tagatose 1,6-diphosphate aldolase GatY/KbaY